jgi:Methyltransferase FkbM domain
VTSTKSLALWMSFFLQTTGGFTISSMRHHDWWFANSQIDILKIDIEGAEYELLQNFPEVFQKAKILCIELHRAQEKQSEFFRVISSIGIETASNAIQRSGYEEKMCLFRRKAAAD